ncbi:tetratricopeptide repeat protein [Aquirufa sp.]|uniref:tetratricopeptide repeat protein n=1 Tax=Aquirufa sp. TaxID=2676249 RepID=UPI0037C17C80
MRINKKSTSWIVAILIFGITYCAQAQQTFIYKDQTLHFRQAKEYFDAKNYVAAREEFNAYLGSIEPMSHEQSGQKVLAEYYITMCSLYMSQPEAEILAERFVANNPEHPQAVKLLRGIGTFFYENGDYAKATKYLSRSSETNLEAKYRLGISYYELKNFVEALAVFNDIKTEQDEEYAFSAAYYAAIIQFNDKRYADAAPDFIKAEGSSKYRREIANWVALCYFNQSKFTDLLNYAEPILAKKNSGYRIDELSQLVADVQFKMDKFEKAAKSYEVLIRASNGKINPLAQYRLGYSLYRTKKFNESANQLKGLLAAKDSLSQYAAFTLALAQLNAGNLVATLDAFEIAKKLPFNAAIQEESAFNHAKVQLDLGHASETIQEIQAFNTQYPTSKFANEATELVADAFLNSNNLEVALSYLKGITKRSPRLNEAYQTLSYNLGVRAYNDERFETAIDLFNKSIETAQKEQYTALASLGKAESLSQLKKFEDAIELYNPLLSGKGQTEDFIQQVRIGLAFAYFNTKEFTKANNLFKAYVDRLKATPNSKNNPTILIRLADTYLISRKYQDALTYYTQAADLAKSEKDYALFQKGMTLSYLSRDAEARQTFKQVRNNFPDSKYAEDALYQENLLLFNGNNYKEAITGFSEIIEAKMKGEYLALSILKRAQAYTNTEQFELALADYKRIINEFSGEKIAKDALIGLQENLIKVGRPEEFGQVLENFQSSTNAVEDNDAIDLKYSAAKGIYDGKKFDKAIPALKEFVSKYPSDENVVEAYYLIADAADQIKDSTEALQAYKKVIEQNAHPQINKAITRAAELELNAGNTLGAVSFYRMHASKNPEVENQLNAYNNIFKAFYAAKQLDSVAKVFIEIEPLNLYSTEEKAKMSRALAEAFSDSSSVSLRLEWLTKTIALDPKGDIGAEAQYQLAYQLSKEAKYKESNDMISNKFKNEFADASDAVIGKAYILLATNFVSLKNLPQAKAILKSIIDNSTDNQVIELAKTTLKSLPLK